MSKLLLWLYGETLEFVPVQAPSLPPKPQIKKNITSNTNDVDEITKDAEAPPLASVPIFKKEKQSLKSPSQNEQSRLEKNIEKIIEKMLNKKFGTITAPSQNEQSRLEKNIEKIIEKMLNERFGTITTLLHPQNTEYHAKSEEVKSLQSVINSFSPGYFNKNNQPDGPERTDSYAKSGGEKIMSQEALALLQNKSYLLLFAKKRFH
ncbi:8713_t:CDS:2 [Gigaspora rosea]|nr:8713_t:CDS:2 [Gigaspora rosea]